LDAYDADPGSSYARDCFYGNVDSDAIRALLAERDQYARILDGLPQDAIDGGWTSAGMSAHAKTLEAGNERLREALIPALGHIRAASRDYGPDANLDEAEAFQSAVLTPQGQGKWPPGLTNKS